MSPAPPLLTIGISSTVNRYKQALKLACLPFPETVEVVVVIQSCPTAFIAPAVPDRVRLFTETGQGLARSRNQVITESRGVYIWFLDDDVEINLPALASLVGQLGSCSLDVLTVRATWLETDTPYGNYPHAGKRLGPLDLLRVSSIEVLVSRSFILRSGARFDPELGLGTDYPSGEENLFLLDCHAKGGVIEHLSTTLSRHPLTEIGIRERWSRTGVLFASGYVARQLGRFLGSMMLIRWSLRALRVGVPLSTTVDLLRGFNWKR